ncbi:uroporphyrinogen III methyltransferase [Psychromonas marina]|uniref:Uroporphyrinogen-III synthase n=1 Tax=Psychromonas marina TaxID=88364 RepID=A0ABQ6DZR2_9GAMM|nr:uroporphyrinogen-III synthase [Psychromonas marina]GLS90595.1 uroporphyrinogen III methyltransferase [Psychromonas marina]
MAKPRLLVTRFAPHAQRLSDLLNEHGIFTIAQPLLEVNAIEGKGFPLSKSYDFIVAVSCNAVTYSHLNLQGKEWPKSHYLAVGEATKSLLEKKTKQLVTIPETVFNSEGLLALPILKNVDNCSILILRGLGGREYLKQHLCKRGAFVDYYESYQRVAIALPTIMMSQKWQQQGINGAIISSIELLEQLIKVTAKEQQSWLKSITLFAASERIINYAQSLGFHHTALLPSIANQDIIDYFTNEDSYD